MKRILTFVLVIFTCSAVFAATPTAKEFNDGNRTKFSTAWHPKSKGINMTMSYPNSWVAKEGERPNVVQKFISDGGRGLEMAFITTKTISLPPGATISENDLKEFFTPAMMKRSLPEGAIFISAKPIHIENLPAGVLEYSWRQEHLGMTFDSRFITFLFIYGTTLVELVCTVTSDQPATAKVLARQMEQFRPLFFLMANSIVLQDKWK